MTISIYRTLVRVALAMTALGLFLSGQPIVHQAQPDPGDGWEPYVVNEEIHYRPSPGCSMIHQE
jgi:hypothetical protein